MKLAYTVREAAEACGFSMDTITRALKTTDAHAFPPPLRAKRAGTAANSKHLILVSDLQDWLERLPPA